MQPGENYFLGLLMDIELYKHPYFDIEYVGFHTDFFDENVEKPTISDDTMINYNATKDTENIFI